MKVVEGENDDENPRNHQNPAQDGSKHRNPELPWVRIRAQLRCAWVLREAADRLEQLQTENDALFRAAMDSRKESGLLNE